MRKTILIFIILTTTILGCNKNPWDDHINPLEGVANQNLVELISNDPQLSIFAGILNKTEWAEELKVSKIYSVWIPTNDAMSGIESTLSGNQEAMDLFVANHIIADNILASGNLEVKTLKMASGKNLLVDNSKKTIDNVSLANPLDVPATNGILHIIDAPLIPRKNLWELIEENSTSIKHTGYLKNLSQMVFDPTVAEQTGIDPISGKPVYDTITGMVWQNSFIENVADLVSEDSIFTAFLLTDDIFQNQYNRFERFFNCGTKYRENR